MNKLLLLSGNDIPFTQGKSIINQPKIKDIAFLGQDIFFLGCNFLCFSKDNLKEQDKINLEHQTNFDVLMSIMNNKKDVNLKVNRLAIELVLSLLFPNYELKVMPTLLLLNRQTQEGKEQCVITNNNFEQFKQIVKQVFCLDTLSGQSGNYNPANKLAESIAKKLEERHKKLSPKGDGQKSINILSRYISILTIGNHHTIPELMQYTVFQLFDQFQRFQKKYQFDMWYQAKLAGAQNLQDVDSWFSQDQDNVVTRPSSNRIDFS